MYNIVIYSYSKIYKIEEIVIIEKILFYFIRSTSNNIIRITKTS